jgi:endonuclease G
MGIEVAGALDGGQSAFETVPLGDSAAFENALDRAKPRQTATASQQAPQQSSAQKTTDQPASNPAGHGGGNWFTRGLGVLQAGVGVVETVGGAAFGVATSETGIGAVAGGAVALHGLDDIQAGVRQAWSGEATQNFTTQAATGAAQKLGASPATAMVIGMGVDIAAGGGFGGGEKAAVKGLEEGGKLLEDGGKVLEDGGKIEKGLEEGGNLVEDGGKVLKNGSKAERDLEDAGKTGEEAAKSGRTAKTEEEVAPHARRTNHSRNAIPAGAIDKAFAGALDEFPGGVAPKILNPKLADKVHEISNGDYAVTYSGVSRTPLVSSEHITKEGIEQAAATGGRTNDFRADLRLPADERSELSDYKGFIHVDRGHMAPHGDMSTRTAGSESFLLSNMVPQAANQNEGVWERIESGVRAATGAGDASDAGRDIYVATGPAFIGNELQSLNGRVLIPTDTWKAVYIPEEGKMGVYWVPNKNTVAVDDIEKISVNELQKRIGIDVFPSVTDSALRDQAEVPAIAEQGRFGGRVKGHGPSVDDLTQHK